jgi:ferritin
MISKKMEKAINGQITKEMYSAYLYMAMSAQCTHDGLSGFATWFMVQYHEEMFHAMKMFNYILDQGGKVTLATLDAPPPVFKSVLDMFEKTLAHELTVTRSIHNLVDLAMGEKDHASTIFLQWYVTEQVEEEKNDNEILQKLRFTKSDPMAVYLLDKEIGTRALTVQVDFSHGIVAPAAP